MLRLPRLLKFGDFLEFFRRLGNTVTQMEVYARPFCKTNSIPIKPYIKYRSHSKSNSQDQGKLDKLRRDATQVCLQVLFFNFNFIVPYTLMTRLYCHAQKILTESVNASPHKKSCHLLYSKKIDMSRVLGSLRRRQHEPAAVRADLTYPVLRRR